MSKLIKGSELTESQKSKIKFNGATNPVWVKSHSFWFNDEGTELSDKPSEHYPITTSWAFLPH